MLDKNEKGLFLKVWRVVYGTRSFLKEKRMNRSRKSGAFLLHSLISNKSWRVKDPLLSVTPCGSLRGVSARQNARGLAVPTGGAATTGMWKKEGVSWAFSLVRGSQRGPTIGVAVGLRRVGG